MTDGFLLLQRKIIFNFCFVHPTTLKIFIWLLVKARFKDGPVALGIGNGITTIHLKRGQLIFGREKAAQELGIPGSTIYDHIQKLEQNGTIKINKYGNH